MRVKIGSLELKNPVMVSSGTFGYGEEFRDLVDLKKLGAIVTKTITVEPRTGNKPPRVFETSAGMLNSIGLENNGINDFIKNKLPKLKKLGVAIIVSIMGEKPGEFAKLARMLDKKEAVAAIELNLSCPNVKEVGSLIAQDAAAVEEIVKEAKGATTKPIIAKLSPNITNIAPIAAAAERAGADAISLINTFYAMSFDVANRKPRLGNVTGGLSGPAIRPIAVFMTHQAAQAVDIPIIAMGGIMDTNDALEFFIAGASAISIGTANFVDPQAAIKILNGLGDYIKENNIDKLEDLRWKRKTKK